MKNKYKAHPLMIVHFIKPTLAALFLPFIKGVVQYITARNLEGVTSFSILVVSVILLIAVLRWRSCSLMCEEKLLVIEYGFLFKRKAAISISKLSSVRVSQNPIDFLFRAATFKINTEAGTHKRIDFQFKLSAKNGRELSAFLYGADKPQPIKYSALKIAILSATTSTAFTGVIVAVPLLNRAGNLLGIGLSEMLLDEISDFSSKIDTYFPPIINVISLVFLLSYLVAFVCSFLKHVKFTLFLGRESVEIRSGILVRTETSFRKSAINNIKVEQTFLMRLLRRCVLKVGVGGYGDYKSETPVVIPLGASREIKNKLIDNFSLFISGKKGIAPKRGSLTKSRFLFLPAVLFLLLIVAAITCAALLDYLTRFVVFLVIVLGVMILLYAYMGLFQYYRSEISFSENIFVRSNRRLSTFEFYCPKEKVGEIRLIRFPADLWHKTCRVKVLLRSEQSESVRVRHIDYEATKSEVFKCFNIE